MKFRIISDEAYLPPELEVFKERHYQDIFGEQWLQVHDKSPTIAEGESVLIVEIDGRTAGWVHFRYDTYSVKFRGFAVQPNFRGQGVAGRLVSCLTEIGKWHHQMLVTTRQKPTDINLMYLTSLVYLDGDSADEAYAFGRFLKRMGFTPYTYNKLQLDPEELAARDAYAQLYPESADQLMVFRRLIVDDGVEFSPEAKSELLRLTPEQLAVVMHGLDVKLGNFERSGRVSYRYDLCPICAHLGSSEQDDSACQQCFIYITCLEPFREPARFKEDYQISNAYFQAMRVFLQRRLQAGV